MAKKEPNLIEHEPEIMTTHGIFKQSQLKNCRIIDATKNDDNPALRCPIARRACFESCAFFDGGTCCIATGAEIRPGVCPFNPDHSCGASCALYKNKNCLLIPKRESEEK